MPSNEPTSDLEVQQQTFREIGLALDALADAFRRAAERPSGLSPGELAKLQGLTRRTSLLVFSVGFPSSGEP